MDELLGLLGATAQLAFALYLGFVAFMAVTFAVISLLVKEMVLLAIRICVKFFEPGKQMTMSYSPPPIYMERKTEK